MGSKQLTIIAEIGSNPAPGWNFKQWCRAADEAGATHIKAQIFDYMHFPEDEHLSKNRAQFPLYRFREFVEEAHANQLAVGASIFDPSYGLKDLVRLSDFIKLASREEENYNLMESVRNSNVNLLPVYRSATTIEKCYWSIVYNYIPMFCIPRYPTPMWKTFFPLVRMARSMNTLGREWGWSSHTKGVFDCLFAVKLGASVIEKHLAMNRKNVEADHSLLPDDFYEMSVRCKREFRSQNVPSQ